MFNYKTESIKEFLVIILIIVSLMFGVFWYISRIVYNWWLHSNVPSFWEFFWLSLFVLFFINQFKPIDHRKEL